MKEAPKIPEGEKMGLRTQPEGYTVEEEGYFSEKRKGIRVGTDRDKLVSVEEKS